MLILIHIWNPIMQASELVIKVNSFKDIWVLRCLMMSWTVIKNMLFFAFEDFFMFLLVFLFRMDWEKNRVVKSEKHLISSEIYMLILENFETHFKGKKRVASQKEWGMFIKAWRVFYIYSGKSLECQLKILIIKILSRKHNFRATFGSRFRGLWNKSARFRKPRTLEVTRR